MWAIAIATVLNGNPTKVHNLEINEIKSVQSMCVNPIKMEQQEEFNYKWATAGKCKRIE